MAREKVELVSRAIDTTHERVATTTEFIQRKVIEPARELAASLIAFANAEGGTIVAGVNRSGEPVGLRTRERAYDLALRASMLCTPPLMLPLPEVLEVEGKALLLISVPKGLPHVYHLRGKYLVRDEKRNAPMPARRLRQLLLERGELGYESQFANGATRSDLDERKIQNYLNAVEVFADEDPDEEHACLICHL